MTWFAVEPPEIRLDAFCLDCDFHVSSQRLSLALITGQVQTFSLSQDFSTLQSTLHPHQDSCRCVKYLENSLLLTGGSDKTLVISDTATNQVVTAVSNAHNSAINSVLAVNSGLIMSGDDDGVIKAWDLRSSSEHKFQLIRHREQISNLVLFGDYSLYSGSIEGVVTEFDLRLPGFVLQSEEIEEEITDFDVFLGGRVLVASTSSGVMVQLQRETLEVVGRLSGHPESVETLGKVGEDRMVTGCADGWVRWMQAGEMRLGDLVCPDEQREYNSDMTFAIEKVCISPDQSLLASVSHEHMVKFWDLRQQPSQPSTAPFFSDLDAA